MTGHIGHFSFTKNFREFPFGKSTFHLSSSTRGSRWRPGHLKDRERYGTGDKDKKTVNGTPISIG